MNTETTARRIADAVELLDDLVGFVTGDPDAISDIHVVIRYLDQLRLELEMAPFRSEVSA